MAKNIDTVGRGSLGSGAMGQYQALAQFLEVMDRKAAAYLHLIALGNTVSGVGDPVGQFTIIGQEHQPRRIGIESAHYKQALRVGH